MTSAVHQLRELLTTPIDREYPGQCGRYMDDPPLTDSHKKEIQRLWSETRNESVPTACICGCSETLDVWSAFHYGSVRLDVFKWMIESKTIDMSDKNIQSEILLVFYNILEKIDVENRPGMADRIEVLAEYIWEFMSVNYPKELVDFAVTHDNSDDSNDDSDDSTGISIMFAPFTTFVTDKRLEFARRLIKLFREIYPKKQLPVRNDFTYLSSSDKKIATSLNLNIGYELAFFACTEGDKKMLDIILQTNPQSFDIYMNVYSHPESDENSDENSDEKSDEKSDENSNNGEKSFFLPLIPDILRSVNHVKDYQTLKGIGECLYTLLMYSFSNGVELINLPIYHGDEKSVITLTNFLIEYKYIYNDSPIYDSILKAISDGKRIMKETCGEVITCSDVSNVISNYIIELPVAYIGNENMFIREFPRYNDPDDEEYLYDEIFNEFQYVKDPSMAPVILAHLNAAYVKTGRKPSYVRSRLCDIPQLADFFK